MVHIHRPKDNKREVLPEQIKSKVLFYGIRNKIVAEKDDSVYAQKEDLGEANIYRVLAYRSRLFNPHADFKVRDYDWKPVSKTVFDNYVSFLNTHRETFLNEAEREYANG